jgi:hypothetical protein
VRAVARRHGAAWLVAALAATALGACGGGDDDVLGADAPTSAVERSSTTRRPRPTTTTAPATTTTAPAPATTGAPPTSGATAPPATGGAVPPTSPPAPPAPADPRIATVTAADLPASWRPGCPVGPEDLRALTITHLGFDGATRTGVLVVRADWAEPLLGVFDQLLAIGYPIERMEPVDVHGGSDDASMAVNNTSAFNCRAVTGGTGWSRHAYGTAIDLNPRQNPYVTGSGTVLPPEGAAYVDRAPAPGVINRGDGVVEAFAAIGWRWGGDWRDPVDYQHFDVRP